MQLYSVTFHFTSHPILRIPILAAALLALMLALAACGGGDAPEPVEPTEAPASTAQPTSTRADAGSTASTPSSASTTAPRSTESPASTGAATPAPTSAAPTSAPAEPTAVPAMVLPPGLLNDRPCEETFREMLANYDGFERFDAALVTALSSEFVELRPDCLAQGWDPEFPDEPVVCEDWTHLPGAIHDGRGNPSQAGGSYPVDCWYRRVRMRKWAFLKYRDKRPPEPYAPGRRRSRQHEPRWRRPHRRVLDLHRGLISRTVRSGAGGAAPSSSIGLTPREKSAGTGISRVRHSGEWESRPPRATPNATPGSRTCFRPSLTPAPPSIRLPSPRWLPGSGRRQKEACGR